MIRDRGASASKRIANAPVAQALRAKAQYILPAPLVVIRLSSEVHETKAEIKALTPSWFLVIMLSPLTKPIFQHEVLPIVERFFFSLMYATLRGFI